jgi:hypothetical protein
VGIVDEVIKRCSSYGYGTLHLHCVVSYRVVSHCIASYLAFFYAVEHSIVLYSIVLYSIGYNIKGLLLILCNVGCY